MKYQRKLFLYFTAVFAVFVVITVFIQLSREKRYKTEEMRAELYAYSKMIDSFLSRVYDFDSVALMLPEDLRFSIIDKDGNVLFDNVLDPDFKKENHINRPEIIGASVHGDGYAIRKSESTASGYIYYAYLCNSGNYIRLALPYTLSIQDVIGPENLLMYSLTLLMIIILLLLLYRTDKYGRTMQSLKKFVSKAQNGELDYNNIEFPDTDSGIIGHDVIELYKQLENSKKEIENEKERNIKMKQDMTNNIAHELKTPVSSIRGYLESLNNNPELDAEKRQHFIERAYYQSLRLTELINDIALITKLEETSKLFEREKINIGDIANEVFNEMEMQIKDANIAVHNNLPSDLDVAGNHNLMYSVFRNLTENVLKYAGNGIQIVTTLENVEDTEYYHIVFYDTGCGIDDKYLEKIFERFVRINEGRGRRSGGTGLGLSIVKHAVKYHGGTIIAENRKEGGLLFRFTVKR